LEQLHVIAISKRRNSNKEFDIYVYLNDKIYLYLPQWELDTFWDYNEKIRKIAIDVDKKLIEWVDFFIEDGGEITKQGNNLYVNGKKVEPFRRLSSQVYANIGLMSTKIFNEFMCSKEVTNNEDKEFLKESFDNGVFLRQISDIVEFNYQHALEINDLNNLDKQIIIRTKIEEYNFIINFLKNILHSNAIEKIDYCIMFLSRVFILESQNFIKI